MNLHAWALLSLLAFPAGGDDDLTPARFKTLHALIVPKEHEEVWLKIPWYDDLWEARKVASEKGMPIFIWNTNGHPFGGV